jgi:hypothetical protein
MRLPEPELIVVSVEVRVPRRGDLMPQLRPQRSTQGPARSCPGCQSRIIIVTRILLITVPSNFSCSSSSRSQCIRPPRIRINHSLPFFSTIIFPSPPPPLLPALVSSPIPRHPTRSPLSLNIPHNDSHSLHHFFRPCHHLCGLWFLYSSPTPRPSQRLGLE